MVSKKRVKRKSLRLRNRKNTRSQTKSRRSKNRIGSKNKRRRSRNTKKRKGGAEATANITDIGNFDFCKGKTTLEECGKYYNVKDENGKEKKIRLCQYTKLKNLLNFFKTAATKGKVDIEKLRNFLENLRKSLGEGENTDKNQESFDGFNEKPEVGIMKEIEKLIEKNVDTDLCIPYVNDVYFRDAYDSYEIDGDDTTYGFDDSYQNSLLKSNVQSRM